MGIAVIIILLIVLLTVGGDGGNQGSGNNTPGYCKASASAEIVRPGLEVLFTILAAST